MNGTPPKKSPGKKTAFVPRLAYGCLGLGMGVTPVCVASALVDCAPSIGIVPAMGIDPDASFGNDASDADGDSASTLTPDASGD